MKIEKLGDIDHLQLMAGVAAPELQKQHDKINELVEAQNALAKHVYELKIFTGLGHMDNPEA